MLVTWFEGFSLYLIANIFFSMISNLLQKVIFLMPILIRDLNRQPPKLVQYGWKASIISQSKKKITKTSINVVFRHSWPGIRVTISRKALVRISWYIPHFEGFCMPVKMQSSICLETKFTPSRLLWVVSYKMFLYGTYIIAFWGNFLIKILLIYEKKNTFCSLKNLKNTFTEDMFFTEL